jgi:hypothetical protein
MLLLCHPLQHKELEARLQELRLHASSPQLAHHGCLFKPLNVYYHVYCHFIVALQHKELEARLKELERAKEAVNSRADGLGQDILHLEEALAAAEERRKGLRKQLAQVRHGVVCFDCLQQFSCGVEDVCKQLFNISTLLLISCPAVAAAVVPDGVLLLFYRPKLLWRLPRVTAAS